MQKPYYPELLTLVMVKWPLTTNWEGSSPLRIGGHLKGEAGTKSSLISSCRSHSWSLFGNSESSKIIPNTLLTKTNMTKQNDGQMMTELQQLRTGSGINRKGRDWGNRRVWWWPGSGKMPSDPQWRMTLLSKQPMVVLPLRWSTSCGTSQSSVPND